MKAVVVVSGGMDSMTLLHLAEESGLEPIVVSFNYGQRHKKELEFVRSLCREKNFPHHVVDLSFLGSILQSSSLTNSSLSVPEGHYAEESMKSTVVPNRNAVMIAIATSLAVDLGAERVWVGVHGGDHFIYPDCRPDFIEKMSAAMKSANEGFSEVLLEAPFLEMTKAQIAELGGKFGVDYSRTWSCYKGGEKHCGRCGTCQERIEAFVLGGVEDPTEYDDPGFVANLRDAIQEPI